MEFTYKPSYYEPFVLPEDYDVKTQGREWSNWNVDEKGIQKMCNLFNQSMGYFNTNRENINTKLGMQLLGDFIIAYLMELEKADIDDISFQYPWGNNWYPFSISSTTTLAYYILLKDALPFVQSAAATAIKSIIKDPQHSLGWTRNEANSAMMLFPWTVAHMLTNTLDTTNKGYQYAIEQYNLAPNVEIKANEDGVHLDYSYLTHHGVYAYGYILSIYAIYPDTKQIIEEVKAFNLDYHIDLIYSKLRHPTIKSAGCALWHREFRLDGNGIYHGNTVTNKCEVIPSMRYLRYFDDNVSFSARAMQTSTAYYESDRNVDNMGLYSALCRRVFQKNDDPTPIFPDVGFIYPKGTTELIRTPSTVSTTTSFFCELGPESEAWAWTDHKSYAIMSSIHMKLPPLLSEEYSEFLCIYLEEERIQIAYRIPMDHSIFLGDREWTREPGSELDQNHGLVMLHIDLKTHTYKSELSTLDHEEALIEFTNKKYSVSMNKTKLNSYWIVLYSEPGMPKIAYIPPEDEVLTPTIVSAGITFELRKDNQYWNIDYDEKTRTWKS
ncbi:ODV-E66 [Penaeus monodon nudivirus]|uniref:ODV-E66 n=1 Tax=Penaeus monodon nudivirus TaxID=1529056 RepID=A0A076FC62_9VIRU|nr:ODV-E66 [Penaeus monodon nudivirus]AII15822.1 ODV-E66 [Penaeus monodon nudivirus]